MSGSPANFCPVWFHPLIIRSVAAAQRTAEKCPTLDLEVLREHQ